MSAERKSDTIELRINADKVLLYSDALETCGYAADGSDIPEPNPGNGGKA